MLAIVQFHSPLFIDNPPPFVSTLPFLKYSYPQKDLFPLKYRSFKIQLLNKHLAFEAVFYTCLKKCLSYTNSVTTHEALAPI